MTSRIERTCAACGKPTAVDNIENDYCEEGSDLACALWQRDELRAIFEGSLTHGVHTEESRVLGDVLGLREGKHTASSTCAIAKEEIEKLRRERDEALEAVAQDRADAVAWMRRAADYVVTRRLMRECGCKPDDEAAKAARQCADAIEKGKHVGAAGEKK